MRELLLVVSLAACGLGCFVAVLAERTPAWSPDQTTKRWGVVLAVLLLTLAWGSRTWSYLVPFLGLLLLLGIFCVFAVELAWVFLWGF